MGGSAEGEAIVLRTVDLGEADRIVSLFFRERGRLDARARGARSSKRRFSGALLLGQKVRATVAPGKGGPTLVEAEVLDAHLGILRALPRIEAVGRALAALVRLLHEDHPETEAYDATVTLLHRLDRGDAPEAAYVAFQLALLDALGHGPALDTCVRCGRKAPAGRPGYFDARLGGLVCRACGGGGLLVSTRARDEAVRLRAGEEPSAEGCADLGEALDRALALVLDRPS